MSALVAPFILFSFVLHASFSSFDSFHANTLTQLTLTLIDNCHACRTQWRHIAKYVLPCSINSSSSSSSSSLLICTFSVFVCCPSALALVHSSIYFFPSFILSLSTVCKCCVCFFKSFNFIWLYFVSLIRRFFRLSLFLTHSPVHSHSHSHVDAVVLLLNCRNYDGCARDFFPIYSMFYCLCMNPRRKRSEWASSREIRK